MAEKERKKVPEESEMSNVRVEKYLKFLFVPLQIITFDTFR